MRRGGGVHGRDGLAFNLPSNRRGSKPRGFSNLGGNSRLRHSGGRKIAWNKGAVNLPLPKFYSRVTNTVRHDPGTWFRTVAPLGSRGLPDRYPPLNQARSRTPALTPAISESE